MLPSPLNHYTERISGGAATERTTTTFAYRIVLDEGRELRVWHDPIECSIYLGRYFAPYLEILDLPFESTWLHEP